LGCGRSPRWVFRDRQKKAESLLIVLIDADDDSVEERRRQLNERAQRAGLQTVGSDEIALLIPKRHIETWIRALLGFNVTEEENCKTNKPPTKDQIRQAAERLFEWSRRNAGVGTSCVPSLSVALPTWQMLGSRLH
jgi:hypothetical protein